MIRRHPRGCVTTLAPLKEALRNKQSCKFPRYYIAPFSLDNYWWGPPGSRHVKPGIIHELTLDRHSFLVNASLHQIRLSRFYMDQIIFNDTSGPPTVVSANSGWFFHNHYSRHSPAVYLFENYWFAYAYVQQLGADK